MCCSATYIMAKACFHHALGMLIRNAWLSKQDNAFSSSTHTALWMSDIHVVYTLVWPMFYTHQKIWELF